MLALIVGIVLIAFCVFACLPGGLGWGCDVVNFLKGFAPLLAAFAGLMSVLIGFADIKDKKEARREEAEAKEAEESSKKEIYN